MGRAVDRLFGNSRNPSAGRTKPVRTNRKNPPKSNPNDERIGVLSAEGLRAFAAAQSAPPGRKPSCLPPPPFICKPGVIRRFVHVEQGKPGIRHRRDGFPLHKLCPDPRRNRMTLRSPRFQGHFKATQTFLGYTANRMRAVAEAGNGSIIAGECARAGRRGPGNEGHVAGNHQIDPVAGMASPAWMTARGPFPGKRSPINETQVAIAGRLVTTSGSPQPCSR